MSIAHAIPILYSSDFPETLRYFEKQLGFARLWDWGSPPSFGAVKRGETELFVCLGGQGQPGTWIQVFVEDVDELHEELRERGARVLLAPCDQPWGMREMQVGCPDGHVLRFGHGLPTAPALLVERREVSVRLEARLASVLDDLARHTGRSVGEVLEETLLHSFEPVPGKEGDLAYSPHTRRTLRLVSELKQRHGLDYDTHANYGFRERPEP